jgi:hypothetical protein
MGARGRVPLTHTPLRVRKDDRLSTGYARERERRFGENKRRYSAATAAVGTKSDVSVDA